VLSSRMGRAAIWLLASLACLFRIGTVFALFVGP
jgi:hypothetical protein